MLVGGVWTTMTLANQKAVCVHCFYLESDTMCPSIGIGSSVCLGGVQ